MTGGVELYVYYRVRQEYAAALLPQVRALQQVLTERYGVGAALKRRPDAPDGVQTWMEVYTATPDAFAHGLEQAFAHSGMAAGIEGERHAEVFMDVSLS